MSDDGAEGQQSRAGVPPNGGMEILFGKVWNVLVRHAGASSSEDARADFVQNHVHAVSIATTWWIQEEWRFMGSLGWGGKLYCEPESFRVGCYLEDRTSHRDAVCKSTNEVLKPLYIEFRKLRLK
jgi:hypothetical protein